MIISDQSDHYSWLSAVMCCLALGCTSPNPDYLRQDNLEGGELLSAGDSAGDLAGSTAGDIAGMDAGETSGTIAGELSGETAGEVAGASGGESGGEPGGDSGGDSGGNSGGDSGGDSGGELGGESSGGEAPCLDPLDCDGDQVVAEDDCNDQDATIFPGAPEVCDGVDNNCNGEEDEIVISCYSADDETLGVGICQAGTRRCVDAGLGPCEGQIIPQEERCDISITAGLDDDCDGRVDEGCDLDQDGVTADQGDCNDRDDSVSPNAEETCNGVDDDCNGRIDEVSVTCYEGALGTEGQGVCRGGEQICIDEQLGTCQGQITPNQEICGTSEDEDCDGDIDEDCSAQACASINRNSPVIVSTECLTAGTYGRLLVRVRPL